MVRRVSSGSSFEEKFGYSRARPAATLVIAGLIDDKIKIEIEVTARIGAGTSQ